MNGDENLGWAISTLLGSDGAADFASSELNDSMPGDTVGNGGPKQSDYGGRWNRSDHLFPGRFWW